MDEDGLFAELERLANRLPETPARFSFLNRVGREHWSALMEIEGPRRTMTIFTVWEVDEDGRASFVTARPLQRRDRLPFA